MLSSIFTQSGIHVTPDQLHQYEQFLDLFIEKNKQINLSAIREEKDIVIKHFIDSLSITSLPQYQQAKNIVDIGSGGGFPGIPLAIYSPEKTFLLNESIEKKVLSIKYFIQELGLSNTKTSSLRAEELGHVSTEREQYDICTARAVAYLPTLAEYCLPMVKIGGYFIAYKDNNQDEIQEAENAIILLGGTLEKIHFYHLPEVEKERILIIIKKEKETPKEYPRRVGVPSKKPL
jgi:16S rRNA (guanine527-N7)-methyltransferase